jgi:hypothetical protein
MNFDHLVQQIYLETLDPVSEALAQDWARKFFHWCQAWENVQLKNPTQGSSWKTQENGWRAQTEFLLRFSEFLGQRDYIKFSKALVKETIEIYGASLSMNVLLAVARYNYDLTAGQTHLPGSTDYVCMELKATLNTYLHCAPAANAFMPSRDILGPVRWNKIKHNMARVHSDILNKDNPGIDVEI